MKKKKRYFILLLILVVYVVFMFLFLGKDNLEKENNNATILVGNSSIWKLSSKKWRNITTPSSIAELNWEEFDVYQDNEKIGTYSLWNDGKWYVFNKNKEPISTTGRLLAINSNYTIDVKNFMEEEVEQDSYINKVLEDNGLDINSQFTKKKKVSFDIDGDNLEEDFYLVSNVFAIDFYPEIAFSFVFMVKDGKVNMLYKNTLTNDGTNGCLPYINSILDIDEDNQYEIILTCAEFSIETPTDMLYKLEKDEFKILISNK